ncbi:MAG: TldD/PmbA family protein, partial [Thermoplasmata archaeon]|nr:TldD/PmbA family protein [Thermoplasmata archaeon]
MIPASEARALFDRLFDRLPPNATADARLYSSGWGTMRFAVGRIHQPHAEKLRGASLRVVIGKRVATATSGDLTPAGLRALVDDALELARAAPEDPKFPPFPGGSRSSPTDFSAPTASLPIERQARLAEEILAGASSPNFPVRVAGVLSTGFEQWYVGNTSGRFTSTRRSIVGANVLVERLDLDPPGSGWSERAAWDVRALDGEALGREAADRVPRVRPGTAKPGKYRVLLDGPASAKLVGELAYLGFGGRGWEEGWSCLKSRAGKRAVSPSLSVRDDATSPLSLPQGIDFEGTPKRRTPLLDHGVVRGPVTDLRSASRLGRPLTGHAPSPEAPGGEYGAMPTQLVLTSTDQGSWEELVKEVRSGLLVTRFHYVRTVHAGRSIITGMTRDGTYRIERGEVTEPVVNLRFT